MEHLFEFRLENQFADIKKMIAYLLGLLSVWGVAKGGDFIDSLTKWFEYC